MEKQTKVTIIDERLDIGLNLTNKLEKEGFETECICATNGEGVDFELPMLNLDLNKDELPQVVIIGKCGLYDEWQQNYIVTELKKHGIEMKKEDFRILPLGIANAIKKLYRKKGCTEEEMPIIIIYQSRSDVKKPFGISNEIPQNNLLDFYNEIANLHASYRLPSNNIIDDSEQIAKNARIQRIRRRKNVL